MYLFYCNSRHLRFYSVLLGLLLLLAVGWFLWPGPEIMPTIGEERLVPVYKVATDQQAVSISFDASWGAEHTQNILDILDQHQVKTTFFLVNIWLEDYPAEAQEIADRGHEIGLHSVTHPRFSQLSVEQITDELIKNATLIAETTGYLATLFRPPFGDYNNRVISTASDLGFTTIQWSIDSLDWKDLSADEISQRVLQNISAGDIVLFHNNALHTAAALPQILGALAEKGLAVVPISELLLTGDTYIDSAGVQRQRDAATNP